MVLMKWFCWENLIKCTCFGPSLVGYSRASVLLAGASSDDDLVIVRRNDYYFFVLIALKATLPTFNARSETSASRSTRM
jgi:hypothetical protein